MTVVAIFNRCITFQFATQVLGPEPDNFSFSFDVCQGIRYEVIDMFTLVDLDQIPIKQKIRFSNISFRFQTARYLMS